MINKTEFIQFMLALTVSIIIGFVIGSYTVLSACASENKNCAPISPIPTDMIISPTEELSITPEVTGDATPSATIEPTVTPTIENTPTAGASGTTTNNSDNHVEERASSIMVEAPATGGGQ